MNLYDFVPQSSKMLHNLDAWLGKASDFAAHKKFEPDTLLQARLAPDQYALVRQVQSACDAAKFYAAYLSGKTAPAHPDTETTLAQLRQRIASCRAFLESVSEADFANAETAKVSPKWLHGKWMTGIVYATQLAMPNFYFHVTTAYAILRHNGVDLGKADFIGHFPLNDP